MANDIQPEVLTAETGVDEADVEVKTADGLCDAALFQPAGEGPWPGVIIFTDARGLRPAFRDMGRRLAAAGYVVLVPNPYYRSDKAPAAPAGFSFANPAHMARMAELHKPLTPEAIAADTVAYVRFLDASEGVDMRRKIGVTGYCMGGKLTLMAAAANRARIGAGVCCHGGGLVTDGPDSPHLLAPGLDAVFYFAVADNDDRKEPDAKNALKAAFDAAHKTATIEVYAGADHGWCVKDGAPYDREAAERAWTHLTGLFASALA